MAVCSFISAFAGSKKIGGDGRPQLIISPHTHPAPCKIDFVSKFPAMHFDAYIFWIDVR